jgi:predicted transcriptional regulator of viral defense system
MAEITPVLRRPDLVADQRLRRNIVDCLHMDAYCGPSVEKITQVSAGSTLRSVLDAASVTETLRRVAWSSSRF